MFWHNSVGMLPKCGNTAIPATCWFDISITVLKSKVLITQYAQIGIWLGVFEKIITGIDVELVQIYYLPTTGV